MRYFIKTFGCQQNWSDTEKISGYWRQQGYRQTKNIKKADVVIINTCLVRESAEERVFGLVKNLSNQKIIITGCMVGLCLRDKTGKYFAKVKARLPQVSHFMPIEAFDISPEPILINQTKAYLSISNGCNNFCSYCVVPFTRGREISRPFNKILDEAVKLKKKGIKNIMLLGQNVNSYGADLILKTQSKKISFTQVSVNADRIKPVFVKHMGKYRIPTLFPHLLENVAQIGFDCVDFMSSNPWDFSDQLIDVIERNSNITRIIHLPVQSGDNNVLKRMNRWYTQTQYLKLIAKLKAKVKNLKLSTDIIVGFCGETDEEFQNTLKLCQEVKFYKAYISIYSPRFGTLASKNMIDDVTHSIKKNRWLILENLINQPNLQSNKPKKNNL